MNASSIHDAITVGSAATFGSAIGIGAEIACLLIGLVLCALRTTGTVRAYGVVGFALLILYVPTVVVSSLVRPNSSDPDDYWLSGSVELFGDLLVSAGLVCLAVAFVLGVRWTAADETPRRAWGERTGRASGSGRGPHRTRSVSRRRTAPSDVGEGDAW